MTASAGMACSCGRSHAPQGTGRRRPPLRKQEATTALASAIYDAKINARAWQDPSTKQWWVVYSGDCLQPLITSGNDSRSLFVKRLVRCRRCKPCLRARQYYWQKAAEHQAKAAVRTWFGTLTLTKEFQDEFVMRAREAHEEPNAEWWSDPLCDARFSAVRAQLLIEVQRYWKRLRSKGHRFKYLLVFERHKSGLPHMHWLLHEQEAPILKRQLQAEWPFGFTQVKLVGRHTAPERACAYVAKYLSKSVQSRQVASRLYRPQKRPVRHSPEGAC